MKNREYPKVIEMYLESSTPNGYGKVFVRSEIVYNITNYNSIVTRYESKYILDERTPKWEDLKGINFLKRIYYVFPAWIIYALGVITGYIIDHLEFIQKLISGHSK